MRINSLCLFAGALLVPAAAQDSDVSGIEIRRDNAGFILGVDGDVELKRSGDSTLSTDSALMVKGRDVERACSNLAVGGTAWDFTHPTKHYLKATDYELPARFTIEMWVYPRQNSEDKYIFGMTSESDDTCLRLTAEALTTDEWHHVLLTWDGRVLTAYADGEPKMGLLEDYEYYCGETVGTLTFGRGWSSDAFNWGSSTSMMLDSVAIYNRAFSLAERKGTGKTCVDTTDPSLVTLWSGKTRGADQIGSHNAQLFFNGFADGASDEPCTNEGVGEVTLGDDYADDAISHVTPAVGAVGWVFPGGSTDYHLIINPFTYPPGDWTMEMWVYPLDLDYDFATFVSFATEDNNNCFPLLIDKFDSVGEWYHVVAVYDGTAVPLVYINGELDEAFHATTLPYCEGREGALSIGQEQDSVDGGYDANQAPAFIFDTLAVYSTAWSEERIAEEEEVACIDLGDSDLYALYSGYSGGTDLVGSQDGIMTASEIVSPGQTTSTVAGGDIDFDVDACQTAKDQSEATMPSWDNTLVGGIGWDFPGDSISYYFMTDSSFTLPDDVTIEFWFYPRTTAGYLLSFANSVSQNCGLYQTNTYITSSMLNQWHHMVFTYDSNDDRALYIDGTQQTLTDSFDFCGERTGVLVIGQEQDSTGGGFVATQSSNAIYDTLAIYNTVWTASDITADTAVGVDLTNPHLVHLYSGATRGKDLVGTEDATLWLYQLTDGMANDDSNTATLDLLSPSTVGGVGWEFPGSSTSYYLATDVNSDFALPNTGFSIETWVKVDSSQSGYWMSYAVDGSDNCLLCYMNAFTSSMLGTWHHVVVTYDTSSTTFYLDGEVDNSFLHSSFCGSSAAGSLVMTQEQDSVGGGFNADQSAGMSIDTVAIYNRALTADEVTEHNGACVDLHDASLMTVWSGFTRGKDLVGNNDASLVLSDWVEGADLDCSAQL